MKLLIQGFFLMLILLLNSETVLANEISETEKTKLISIQATRYEISFQNVSKHSLRVIIRNRVDYQSQYFLIDPGQTNFFKGSFDKQKLQDMEIICVYDLETFRKDIERLKDKILLKNAISPTTLSTIKKSDWFQFVENFIAHKDVSGYLENYDFSQFTINEKTAKDLAGDISAKISKDRSYLGSNGGNPNLFASAGISSSKAAVAVVLELANNANEYEYKNQIAFLRSSLELLSDRKFIADNKDLVYNIADVLDLRTSTPKFIFSFSPILFTQKLNDTWNEPNEIGFDKEKVISGGWFNNTLSAKVSFPISPEINLLKNLAYSRVYGAVSYEKISYELEEYGVFQVRNDYLSLDNPNPSLLYSMTNIKNIQLEMRGATFSAFAKTMIKEFIFIDLEAGVLVRSGRFNFGLGDEHFDDVPDVLHLTYNREKVVKTTTAPFLKVNAGIGYNTKRGQGLYLIAGLRTFQSALETTENFGLFKRTSTSSDLVSIASKPWLLSLDFGMAYMF